MPASKRVRAYHKYQASNTAAARPKKPPTDPPMMAPRFDVEVVVFVLLFWAPATEELVGNIVCVSVIGVIYTLPSAAVDDNMEVIVLSEGRMVLEVDGDVGVTGNLLPPEPIAVHEVPKSVFITVFVTGKTVV